MKYKKYQKVEIDWFDSCEQTSWIHEDSLDLDEKYLHNKSIGYYWSETKNTIVIVRDFTSKRDKNMVNSVMQIPKSEIRKITKL